MILHLLDVALAIPLDTGAVPSLPSWALCLAGCLDLCCGWALR